MLKTKTGENFDPDQLSLFGPGDIAGTTDAVHMEKAGSPIGQIPKRANIIK